MRSRIQAIVLPGEAEEFGDDLRRIFRELGRTLALEGLAGECSPPIDVYETDSAVHVSMDLPGVDQSAVRIVVKSDALLIAGEKMPRRGRGDATFHLVERGIGRFARSVRLSAPIDVSRARARLEHGELHVTLPKIADRRGRPTQIPIDRA